ncbi:SatD family protein [Microbacterium maritypicum]|uniref:SatD family protein n=1 Tax=Microbacterium TaxID=33882 RepID=UPI0004930C74|nr:MULTISPECIES: SatD family protein [unclassified Microbacterium]MCV0335702.1 SatD family protein [Microbacterium sp.]MCV0377455.1 SatD family protein [Microbacterium sp.]MCV0390721.1 SatD family protein [Microbacterium sp.]MCV0418456.1 SatD family protein [Microbacterium sp.]MCV0421876.1 SatD family protein [Microbacterium sp.]
MVIAVLADIVGSRRLDDRTAAQRVLDDTIAAVEVDLPLATQPLTPTVGDEQQGVYRDLSDAMVSLLMIQLRLPDGIAFRFGIGVGEVRPVESVHRELADGPGWYAARAAIETVHAREGRAVPRTRSWIVGAPGQDEVMESTIAASNAYLLVRDEVVGAMSERERRLTYGRLLGRSQQELATEEGITQPSVSKSLRTAGTAALIEGVAALRGERA